VTLWNRFEQYFKHNQLRLLESFLGKPGLNPQDFEPAKVKRILIVRQHDQLGDFLLSTPAFKAIRAKFPSAYIAVVARKYTASLAEHHDCLNAVIPLYEHGCEWAIAYPFKFWRQVRSGFDLAIVLNTVSHSLTSDLIARFSQAQYILGSGHQLFTGTQRNFFYNLIAPLTNSRHHQSERNLDIVRYIGANTDDLREHITLLPSEKEWARTYLLSRGWIPQKLLIAIHPGAGKIVNRWPVKNFASVGDMLGRMFTAQLLVTWGPKEESLGHELIANLKHPSVQVANLSLRELAAVFSQTALLLCNDTGVMHLAASVGTPLVAIFGPTDPALWKPVGDQFVAVRAADLKCASVTPEQVLEAAAKLLRQRMQPEKKTQ